MSVDVRRIGDRDQLPERGAREVGVSGLCGLPAEAVVKRLDPYLVLHWAALAGVIGFGAWAIVLIACWRAEWSGIPQVIAAALGVAGCVVGLSWLKERELNAKLPAQWDKTPGAVPGDDEWEVGS